ncbi:hypothetical protein BD779DRAFT_1551758 [Infundibulicybe gibba]|nr:hypothetical protein BD779DRAFT_1551758 [Infundibulicybe gibba]
MGDHPPQTLPAPHNVFSGHLGHLTPAQEEALKNFKQSLANAKLYDATTPSHNDPTLL